MSHDDLPLLTISAGEPAGIGPDIVVALATREYAARLLCVADPRVLAERAQQLQIPLTITECQRAAAAPRHTAGNLAVLPIATHHPVTAGQLDVRNAHYVLECITHCVTSAERGAADAIVTGPVHKGLINDAGFSFTGHTEYLAERLKVVTAPVMMLTSGQLRVALVTTHLPLRDVAASLDSAGIQHTIETVAAALRDTFDISDPQIAVCGLNPHAGESGHLGHEDDDIIRPAIAAAAQGGIAVRGPLPADTAFTAAMRASVDAYVTMYHDQGLPVIKALGFGATVNITLGLPILRTSVDHGTACHLAGSGASDPASLNAAVTTAIDLVVRKRA